MDRDTTLLQITSGNLYINIDDREFLIKSPSLETRYKAQLLYNKKFNEFSLDSHLLSRDDLLDFLIRNNLWTISDQERLDSLPTDIENLKVQLFELVFQSNRRKEIKQILKEGRKELNQLHIKRHQFDHITPEGNASISKLYFLIGESLYHFNSGKKVYRNSNWINKPNSLIHRVVIEYNNSVIGEKEYRELARTDPWRSIWNAGKNDDLFGVAAVNLSDEQKNLVFWSRLYDNIYENPDCPDDSIIEDDDILDGWLISQRRKREQNRIESEADKIAGRHGNADEIFVPVGSAEDAKKVNLMNTNTAKMIKQQRFAAIKNAGGELNEADLPDVKRNIMMKANNAGRK